MTLNQNNNNNTPIVDFCLMQRFNVREPITFQVGDCTPIINPLRIPKFRHTVVVLCMLIFLLLEILSSIPNKTQQELKKSTNQYILANLKSAIFGKT